MFKLAFSDSIHSVTRYLYRPTACVYGAKMVLRGYTDEKEIVLIFRFKTEW